MAYRHHVVVVRPCLRSYLYTLLGGRRDVEAGCWLMRAEGMTGLLRSRGWLAVTCTFRSVCPPDPKRETRTADGHDLRSHQFVEGWLIACFSYALECSVCTLDTSNTTSARHTSKRRPLHAFFTSSSPSSRTSRLALPCHSHALSVGMDVAQQEPDDATEEGGRLLVCAFPPAQRTVSTTDLLTRS
jgi:hypothetical protein